MDERLYKTLKLIAIGLGVMWLGWAVYENFSGRSDYYVDMETGRKYFKDGDYEESLAEFQSILAQDPEQVEALDGAARSLMQLGRNDEAMVAFDEVIAREPDYQEIDTAKRLFGAAYANRGILNDRMGNYPEAIADYEKAAELEAELNEGPAWLIRFLRNQPEQQSTILQRAEYLRAQLALPEEERLLRVPEIDAEQRPYDQ